MAWLIPVLIERRGVTYLDVTWISAVTGAPLFSRASPWPSRRARGSALPLGASSGGLTR
jgi:hypothetical protein